jgi:uncharacterized membrane protein YkoI
MVYHKGAYKMKSTLIAAAIVSVMITSPAWALFETNKELAATAKITLDEAVKNAVKAVPGKAVEADIGKEEGRTVYKIEIIDSNNKTQKVYVDAVNGQARIDK